MTDMLTKLRLEVEGDIADLTKSFQAISQESIKVDRDLKRVADRIKRDTVTAEEKLQKELADTKRAFKAGLIDMRQYERALEDVQEQAERLAKENQGPQFGAEGLKDIGNAIPGVSGLTSSLGGLTAAAGPVGVAVGVATLGIGGLTAAASVAQAGIAKLTAEMEQQFTEVAELQRQVERGFEFNSLVKFQLAGGSEFDPKTIADLFDDVSERVTEAANGAGEVELFEKLKLDTRELQKLKPEEAFIRIRQAVDQLEGTARGDALNKLFGSDQEAIRLTTERLREAEMQAERFGLTLSKTQQADFAEANKELRFMHASFSGLSRQIGAEMAPAIAAFAELGQDGFAELTRLVKENQYEVDLLVSTLETTAEVSRGAAEGATAAFKEYLEVAKQTGSVLQEITAEYKRQADAASKIPGFSQAADFLPTIKPSMLPSLIVPGDLELAAEFLGLTQQIAEVSARSAKIKQDQKKTMTPQKAFAEEMKELLLLPAPLTEAEELASKLDKLKQSSKYLLPDQYETLRKRFQAELDAPALAAKRKEMEKAQKEAAAQAKRFQDTAEREAKSLAETFRTPAQIFAQESARLKELLDKGFITDESTFDRAMEKLVDNYDKATAKLPSKIAAANRNVSSRLADLGIEADAEDIAALPAAFAAVQREMERNKEAAGKVGAAVGFGGIERQRLLLQAQQDALKSPGQKTDAQLLREEIRNLITAEKAGQNKLTTELRNIIRDLKVNRHGG